MNNEANSQFDLPITPRAFLFRCFDKIENALILNKSVNLKLFNFYLKYAKPQYQTWSLKKIIGLKVCSIVPTEDFRNIRFKGFQGKDKILDEFTLDAHLLHSRNSENGCRDCGSSKENVAYEARRGTEGSLEAMARSYPKGALEPCLSEKGALKTILAMA
ncbi:unnamed protein product [Lactuca saligna]|uniref:Uncharacterized protein n=1 Tax=Lactuca saligna TaxID=75948 RepID=A0AA35V6K8_LACSI|nr:unnamed protein product [Lactuca saligna]